MPPVTITITAKFILPSAAGTTVSNQGISYDANATDQRVDGADRRSGVTGSGTRPAFRCRAPRDPALPPFSMLALALALAALAVAILRRADRRR
jgi:hypothetical protein